MPLPIPKTVRAAWAARTCRPSARRAPADDYLGDSLMDGPAVPMTPSSALRSKMRAWCSRVSGKIERAQFPLWAKGKKRHSCGATQTEPELRPVLRYQESSTSRVPEQLPLITEYSSSFQPEMKQDLIAISAKMIACLQCETVMQQGKLLQAVQDKALARWRALRAELQGLPHNEQKDRGDIQMEADNEWKALTVAFKTPRTSGGAAKDEHNDSQLRFPNEGEDLQMGNAKLQLIKRLGDGACGAVYVAAVAGTPTKVAVKYEARPDRARAKQQLDWAISFEHKNLVKTALYRQKGPYIVSLMQLGDVTLNVYAKRQELSLLKKTQAAAGVAEGVSYLHGKGFVHNDLDDSNIVMWGATPLITDFGTLVPVGERCGFNGRPQMAPPEKCGLYGKAEPTPAVPTWDTYSLGLLAHQVFAGCLPGDRADLMDRVWAHTCVQANACSKEAFANNPELTEKLALKCKATYCGWLATVGPEKHAEFHTPAASVPPLVSALLPQLWAWDAAERPTAQQAADRLKELTDDLKAAANTDTAVEPAGDKTA